MQGKHPTLPASGPPPTARPHPPASPELKSTTTSPTTTLAVHAVDAHFLQRLRAALVACLDRKLHAELQLDAAQRALRAADDAYEDAHALLRAATDAVREAEARAAPLGWK